MYAWSSPDSVKYSLYAIHSLVDKYTLAVSLPNDSESIYLTIIDTHHNAKGIMITIVFIIYHCDYHILDYSKSLFQIHGKKISLLKFHVVVVARLLP